MPLRVVYMGTPEFAVPALRALCDANHEIIAVYTQPPRPAGRGQQLHKSPIHEFAESKGMRVHTPDSLKSADVQSAFQSHNADIAVVAAYGLLIPKAMLSMPRLGCINLHASLLPRWRGAAPIQRAIMAGDHETGMTIMQMDAGLDTGAMWAQASCVIDENTTAGALHDTLAEMGASLLMKTLPDIVAATRQPVPQPDGTTYAAKISKSEVALDWKLSATQLRNHIHGLSPHPGAHATLHGEPVKILHARVASDETGAAPGTILNASFHIACSAGVLQPLQLQRPGKKVLPLDEFLRGNPVKAGERL